jgi:hypothetical protein
VAFELCLRILFWNFPDSFALLCVLLVNVRAA